MSSAQEQAYETYQNAKTEGTKMSLHYVGSLHSSFVEHINNFQEPDPESVDVSHLGSIPFSKEAFYRTLVSETFHTYWSRNSGASGPGNTLLVDLRRNTEGHYVLTYRGFQEVPTTFTLENPNYLLSSNSIVLDEGVVKFLFRLTRKNVNESPIWNHQILVNGRLFANYDLVSFQV